ncbi:unnamed protein product [Microthlaspi erraticum]|uniref:CCHC-type domain-containing protein n=1 Tax=Microthlaspi erraticum TaxID=1685480 RepID=A0A6D2K487_9BRAS|nr:unnamed protein product [Microthlaspi erraticum]
MALGPWGSDRECLEGIAWATGCVRCVDRCIASTDSVMSLETLCDALFSRGFVILSLKSENNLIRCSVSGRLVGPEGAGVTAMLHKAILAEQQIKRRTPARHGADQRRPVYARDSRPVFTPKSEPRGVPYNQDKDKNKASTTSAPRARELKCFRCQGFRHYANECHNKKIMFIRDNGEVESEEEVLDHKPEPEPEEYEAVPVMGKILVARRLLSAQVQTHKEEQRENLFHSRCLVQEKVCSLIID